MIFSVSAFFCTEHLILLLSDLLQAKRTNDDGQLTTNEVLRRAHIARLYGNGGSSRDPLHVAVAAWWWWAAAAEAATAAAARFAASR